LKKCAVLLARLVLTPEAFEARSNADVEREVLDKKPAFPYVARIEKVVVLDGEG
jgi:hypothetical protein